MPKFEYRVGIENAMSWELSGVRVLQWDLQEPGDHTIETDWTEDLAPEENA